MSTGYTDAENPHIKLSELMNRELGTTTSPTQIRRFIDEYWDRVSWFAHSIRHEIEREKAKPTRTPEQALDAIVAIVDAAVSGTTVDREQIKRIADSAKTPKPQSDYHPGC